MMEKMPEVESIGRNQIIASHWNVGVNPLPYVEGVMAVVREEKRVLKPVI